MATIVLQAAGAYLGGFLGSTGAAIGSAAGALAGYVLDRSLINGTRHIEGPRLAGARPFTAEEGAPIPRIYGTVRTGGTLIWATRFEETATTERQGFKGGPKVTEYSYFANAAFLLCEGPISGIRRVWADGREVDRERIEMRVHTGTETQAPDPLIEAKQGEGNAPAFRGSAYVVFDRLPLGEYGNRIPQLQFEVIRAVGGVAGETRAVALIPGSTEYGYEPSLVIRTVREGQTEAANRHVLHGPTDFAASLDELQMLCPNLEHVALVVTWFGDDLRAGECRIRPSVIDAAAASFSQDWVVSGVGRGMAREVSREGGGAAFGGSPSDGSVIDAIADIRNRGLKVTLYPFVMMDIPAGNALADPHGKAEQAAYPWRGRITCHPGPSMPSSADNTAAARSQVEAFCGAAAVGDFTAGAQTVAFSGDAGDWGYRRFVLHYAHLAAMAGGVDAFLLGSELRGLTTLRDDANAFPFVEALCALAGEVRGILGGATGITYGADWSEYFGHHPADGSGDVFFHLDPLWTHAAIDAVGIDNYMPLSDWRDSDYGGGNPDGLAGPYDPDGLAAAIAGGEGFDWYYPDAEARRARTRAPITDGAYGKDWVFRAKDLVGWWSNAHYNRIGGIEAAEPTAWTPGAKPLWLMELGCPATDKGPNQPNVFPDPKSSESAVPYFSNGGRSDQAQQAFIAAHQRHWNPASDVFQEANNPVSATYGGRMLDFSRTYLWAWDARPFPAFPLLGDIWRDGANWSQGHWLNGRLSGLTAAELIAAILADHGLPPADVSHAGGTLHGYMVADPSSARASLEPLAELFGIAASETADGLIFRDEAQARPPVVISDIAADDHIAFEQVRTPDNQLPVEALLAYRDPFTEYQAASARALRIGADGARQATVSFPGVLEPGHAQSLLDDWMQRKWALREGVNFGVAPNEVEVAPGAIVTVPGRSGDALYLVDQIDEGMVKRVSAYRIKPALPAVDVARLPTSANEAAVFGQPLALFLDLPMAPGGPEAQDRFCAALWAEPWRTQLLFASPEASGYARRASLSRRATVGSLVEALGPGREGRLDRSQAIVVELFSGELASVSRLLLLNGANAAAVLSASGVWEVVQFETAEEIAPSTWRLGGLLRGQLGTGDAAASGADAGARFVLLDGAVRPAGLQASEAGLTLNWRAGPSGFDFSSTYYAEQTLAGGLRALAPLSPVHIRASRTAAGDLDLTWVRRGRIDADGWLGPDIPLGEETEAYSVGIAAAGGAAMRTATVLETGWTYAAADIAEDFPELPATIDISIRQLSAKVGWGIPGTAQFIIT
jgi:hypothetical protein